MKTAWNNLSIDDRAQELAKTAMGWEQIPLADRIGAKSIELVRKAQEFKTALMKEAQ